MIVPQQVSSPSTEKSSEQGDQSNSEFQQAPINMEMNFEQNQLNNQLSNPNDIQKQLDLGNQNDMAVDEEEEEEDRPLQINIENKGICKQEKVNEVAEMHKANNKPATNKIETNNVSSENEKGFKGFISDDLENNMTYITTRYPYLSRLYPIVRQACVRR